MKTLLETATAEIGVKERPGARHNARVVQYAKEAGFDEINDDETPWCSIFMNWVAYKSNMERSKSMLARSWQKVGEEIPIFGAKKGDVVVFWRGSSDSWQGHVGIYLGMTADKQKIMTLGGNQSNQVSIANYPLSQLLSVRRLRSLEPSVLDSLRTRGISKFETYRDAVNGYLKAKETPEFQSDENRFEKYPVTLQAADGSQLHAYIQDAVLEQSTTNIEPEKYIDTLKSYGHDTTDLLIPQVDYVPAQHFSLDVILLTRNLGQILHIQTECIGPAGCLSIEWDKVKCAWNVCG